MSRRLPHMVSRCFAIFAGAALASSAVAGSFPTVWTIESSLPYPVVVECTGTSATGGLTMTMSAREIPTKGQSEHSWGAAWHNDGMGLNAGRWTCKAGKSQETLTAAGSFKTDWGESLGLAIGERDGKLTVTKGAPAGDVARGEGRRNRT